MLQKKFLLLLFLIFPITLLCTSCKKTPPDNHNHTHEYNSTWSYDSSHHWHSCVHENCNEKQDKSTHEYILDTCSICGYIDESRQLQEILFESSIRDEDTGYAIFEVDINTSTQLTYKINPSTAAEYKVSYIIKNCPAENHARFQLRDGKIKVVSTKFEEIQLAIFANGHSDTCIIRLKSYPNNIFFYNSNDEKVQMLDITLSLNDIYSITLYGEFIDNDGNTYIEQLNHKNYNFIITSDNETEVTIISQSELTIGALKNNTYPTTVTIQLLNGSGYELFTLQLNCFVF